MKIANGEAGQINIAPGLPHVPTQLVASRWSAAFDEMETLSQGWDSYRAPPPSALAIASAKRVVAVMSEHGLPATRVAPSVIGGVGVTRRVEASKVYIELRNDGRAYSLSTHGEDPVVVSVDLSVEGLDALLASMRSHFNG